MAEELVPELHDIGKLTTLWVSRSPHNFEDFDFSNHGIEPDSPIWHGILDHHCADGYGRYPGSRSTFLCCVADLLASSVSRPGRPAGGEPSGSVIVQKAWCEPHKGDFPFVPAKEAARFVSQDPTAEEYFQRFGALLEQRAEETRRPVTSLRTHSELTGKFYSLLARDFPVTDDEIRGKTKEQVSQLLEQKSQIYTLNIACLKPRIFVKPFRTRDLGIFHIMKQIRAELSQRFCNNILFQTPEQVLLAYREGQLDEIIRLFTDSKLWVQGWRAGSTLRELEMLTLVETRGPHTKHFTGYPSLSPQITTPLCELCQMAEGSKSRSEDGSTEWLCDTCSHIREQAPRLSKLARWERDRVLWVQVELRLEKLVDTLKSLYENLLKSLSISAKAEVRFSLLSEFQKDYYLFLTEFRNRMGRSFGDVEWLVDNLFCVRVENLVEIIGLLKIYSESLNKFFPKFNNTIRSPISLSISSSEAKFPFFEHFRVLNEAKEEICVNIVGHGSLRASLKALPAILNASDFRGNQRTLYRLAEVARISESLAKLKMYDRLDDDQVSYRRLREDLLPFGLSYQSILTLAKIAGG